MRQVGLFRHLVPEIRRVTTNAQPNRAALLAELAQIVRVEFVVFVWLLVHAVSMPNTG